MQTVKVVIMQIGSEMPGSFTWHVFQMPEVSDERIWKAMGHRVIELDVERAKELRARCVQSLLLQNELAELYTEGT